MSAPAPDGVLLVELATDPEMKAVVITGAGSVFSAGLDLSEFERAVGEVAFGNELWASSDRFTQGCWILGRRLRGR